MARPTESNNLQARTELAKVYQEQKRYDEAEAILKESLVIDPKQLHPRTELARVYIKIGLLRRARAEVINFLRENRGVDPDGFPHLMLAYLNACHQMSRYQEGTGLVDRYGGQFISPELAEEYGRLLRHYDLAGAVGFFQTAARKFPSASRLLSEAAVCFKLAGRGDAEEILEKAVRLEPNRGAKYRDIFDRVRSPRLMAFREKDCTGLLAELDCQVTDANPQVTRGVIESQGRRYSFRSNRYVDLLFGKMKINDEVVFDIITGSYAVNIEPYF